MFDPDKLQKEIESIDPTMFGFMIAKMIQTKPSSQNWALVNSTIEEEFGWDADHEQVQELINRIANQW